MAKTAKMQEVSLSKLVPYERNAKIHGNFQIQKLKASIEEFGFLTPCLIDRDYNIIAGHGRVMAAKELGMAKVPCVFVEGLTEEQRRAYILADNRLGELGEWDMEIVSGELDYLAENGISIDVTGFTEDDRIFDIAPLDDNGIGDEIDQMTHKEQISRTGEIWALGDHRLMVGDSTNLDDVLSLMGGYGRPSGDRSTIQRQCEECSW